MPSRFPRRAAPRRGFTNFIPLDELNDASRHFIQNDTLTVVVEARVTRRLPREPLPSAVSQGFEPDLFAQQPVADEMLCGVCLAVMNDPVSCADGAHKCAALRRRCSRLLPLR